MREPQTKAHAVPFQMGTQRYVYFYWETERPELPECLTAAETEVARLALEGLSNELIAYRRAVSVRTVSNQLASVFLKLGVRTRAELAFLIASGSQERP